MNRRIPEFSDLAPSARPGRSLPGGAFFAALEAADRRIAELDSLRAENETLRADLAASQESAGIDAQTGLWNKEAFRLKVGERMGRLVAGRRAGEPEPVPNPSNAILFLDIDDFKATNDALTHPGADHEVLEPMASRLQSAVRPNDVVGRLGGEEFGIYLENVDSVEALAVAVRIQNSINQIHMSKKVNGRDWVSCTVGIVELSLGGDYDDVLTRASALVLEAKKAGSHQKNNIYTALADINRGPALKEAPSVAQ